MNDSLLVDPPKTEQAGVSFDVDADKCKCCNKCQNRAPYFFRGTYDRHNEQLNSFVYRQPVTPTDIALCTTAMESCPNNAIDCK